MQNEETYRRATGAALAGLLVQLVLTIVIAIVGMWAKSPALHAATWHLLGGLPIWVILLLLFHQHRLERAEALETEQLARADAKSAALFEERADDLNLARRRLANIYRWWLGVVSLVTSIYLLVASGVLLWINARTLSGESTATSAFFAQALDAKTSTLVLMALCAGVALTAFLVARYIAGMTRVSEWQLLRGGASYLMGNALVAALALLAAASAHLNLFNLMAYLRLVIPGLMILIGVEILVTFLLSAYRPKRTDEIARPAFDSRVLGLLTTPESIAKAISEAINYQFGFEVSRSWFYRLVGQSITPLIVFALLILLLASSVVIVGPHEQTIVTRFGRIVTDPPLRPGLHLKLPWPISSAQKEEVQRIQQLNIGSLASQLSPGVPILWTNKHVEGEELFLITAPSSIATGESHPTGPEASPPPSDNEAPPSMSLVAAEIVLHYKISNLVEYVQSAADPKAYLRAIGDTVVNTVFATTDIDALLTRRRGASHVNDQLGSTSIGTLLEEVITEATRGLGVTIMNVSVAGIHPPQVSEVALSFHELIGAMQEEQSTIEKAKRQSIERLATAAGTEQRARDIYDAILAHHAAKDEFGDGSPEAVTVERRVNQMLVDAQGEVAQRIYDARAYRWEKALTAKTRAERFATELLAYDAAPEYYRAKRRLASIEEGLQGARKVLVPTTGQNKPIIRLDLTESRTDVGNLLTPER